MLWIVLIALIIVTVIAHYAPKGSPDSYTLGSVNKTLGKVAWRDRTQIIRYSVSPDAVHMKSVIRSGLHVYEQALGIRFEERAHTPWDQYSAGVSLVFRGKKILPGVTLAQASPGLIPDPKNRDFHAPSTFESYVELGLMAMQGISASQQRAVIVHELGHVFGLKHTTDKEQIMFRLVGAQTVARLQAGDLAGLMQTIR